MRELRIVVAVMPPLLADLVKRAVSSRLELSGVTLDAIDRIDDLDLRDQPADLVIVDQQAVPLAQPEKLLSGPTPVLILSTDRTRIFGPDRNDVAPLTLDNLAARLLDIAK